MKPISVQLFAATVSAFTLLSNNSLAFPLLSPRRNKMIASAEKTETMKAMEFKDGKFQKTEIDKPTPSEDQVLVKVSHSSIGKSMRAVTEKKFAGKFLHSLKEPLVLGWNFAGTIEAVGDEVTAFDRGAPVWGHLQYDPKQEQGSFSEYVTVPAEDVAAKPEKVPCDLAAGAATETLTALQALRDIGGLQEGGKVLILGAAGGVGSAAVGVAKRLGAAFVAGVCSTKDVDRVKALGADVVIDREKQDPLGASELQEHAFDVVLDTPAAYSYGKCAHLLSNTGAYVSTLPKVSLFAGQARTLFGSRKCSLVTVKSKQADLELVGDWLADGLKVPIDATYKIADLNEANEHRMSHATSGVVVIDVAQGW